MALPRINPQEPKPLPAELIHFDQLPDSASVRAPVVAAITSYSLASVWRLSRDDPDFPKPRKYGPMRTTWNVGDIRRWLASR